jgi:phage replication O-like protein O
MTHNDYTAIPNELLANMDKLKETSEIKIFLAVCRKTIGWQKPSDIISFTQFQEMTGMHPMRVSRGIKGALKSGMVVREKVGDSFSYKVQTPIDTVEPKTTTTQTGVLTKQEYYPNRSTSTTQTGVPVLVRGTTQTGVTKERKETIKEMGGEVIQAWNGANLSKCVQVSDGRKKHLMARLSDPFFSENWAAAIERVRESAFCNGHNDRKWKADIDWFLKPDSVARIMEGKYDNKTPTVSQKVNPDGSVMSSVSSWGGQK